MSTLEQATHLLTVELAALPEQPGVRYELVEGILVEMPGAGGIHAALVMRLVLLLHSFVSQHRLGRVFADGLAYILRRDPDTVRIPDVSVVRRERIPPTGIPEGFWPGPPDLAVEIVSPTDRAEDVHDRVHDYLAAGTSLVWVLWPRARAVTVHTPDGLARELGPNSELHGEPVLPGFRVGIAELFALDAPTTPST